MSFCVQALLLHSFIKFLANFLAVLYYLPEQAGSKRDSGVASYHVICSVGNLKGRISPNEFCDYSLSSPFARSREILLPSVLR